MRAFLATLALACSVHAGAAQTCAPTEAVMAMVRAHPGYAAHHVASAEETRIAAAIFNAAPPESDIGWTLAILVSFKDGSGGVLVGLGGEIGGSLGFQPVTWPAFVRTVRGEGA